MEAGQTNCCLRSVPSTDKAEGHMGFKWSKECESSVIPSWFNGRTLTI